MIGRFLHLVYGLVVAGYPFVFCKYRRESDVWKLESIALNQQTRSDREEVATCPPANTERHSQCKRLLTKEHKSKTLSKTSYLAVSTRLKLQSARLSLWLAARHRNGSGSMALYSRVRPQKGSVAPDIHRNQAQWWCCSEAAPCLAGALICWLERSAQPPPLCSILVNSNSERVSLRCLAGGAANTPANDPANWSGR